MHMNSDSVSGPELSLIVVGSECMHADDSFIVLYSESPVVLDQHFQDSFVCHLHSYGTNHCHYLNRVSASVQDNLFNRMRFVRSHAFFQFPVECGSC